MGRPLISTIGFGRVPISSEIRAPSPRARMTTFIHCSEREAAPLHILDSFSTKSGSQEILRGNELRPILPHVRALARPKRLHVISEGLAEVHATLPTLIWRSWRRQNRIPHGPLFSHQTPASAVPLCQTYGTALQAGHRAAWTLKVNAFGFPFFLIGDRLSDSTHSRRKAVLPLVRSVY